MPRLPSGRVTFLFTDIEGSRRLLEQFRDRYADVLAEHERLLRNAFAEAGGYEIDTQGDAFLVAFARARDALLAAITAERAMHGHSWPDGAAVLVRIDEKEVAAAVPVTLEDRRAEIARALVSMSAGKPRIEPIRYCETA